MQGLSYFKAQVQRKAESSPFSRQNTWTGPSSRATSNPAFLELLRPSLVHVLSLFCPHRFWRVSRVKVAPEIKAPLKEQRSRRRAPIKMMKIFHFYLGILVRSRVCTNTDHMGFFVWVLFYLLHFLVGLYNVSISKQHWWVSAKELQSRRHERRTTWSWTSHPGAHTMSGFDGVSRGSMESGLWLMGNLQHASTY